MKRRDERDARDEWDHGFQGPKSTASAPVDFGLFDQAPIPEPAEEPLKVYTADPAIEAAWGPIAE